MEYFKNIKDEITRSLDSDQVKKDQPSATDSSELPQNAETNAEISLVKSVDSTSSQPETNWGKWEDVKTTPTSTPTSTTNKGTGSRTDTKQTTASLMATPPGSSVTPTKSKLDSLSKEELLERVKKQTVLLQKMKARSEELTKECNKLKMDAVAMEQQANVPSNTEALMQEMQVLKNERDQLLTEVKSVKQIISSITKESESKIGNLEAEKTALQTLLEHKKDEDQEELDSLRFELKSVQEKMVICSTEKDELMKEKEGLLKENKGLKEQDESKEHDLQEMVKLLQEEKEMLCRNSESLSQQLNETRERFKKDKETLLNDKNKVEQDLQERLSESQEQLKTVRHDLNQSVSEIKQLKMDYETLKESYEANQQERIEVERKLDELKDELLTVKNSESTLQHKVAELESNNQVPQVTNKDLVDREESKKEELEEMKKQLRRTQEEKDLLVREMENINMKYNQEKEQLLEKMQHQTEGISSLSASLSDVKTRESSLVEENGEIKAQIKEIQRTNTEEVKKLKAIAVKLKKELGEAKGKEESLREEFRKCMSEGSDMKLKYDQLKEEMDQVTNQLQSCQEQLGTDQTKQYEDKEKIKSLEDQLSLEISKNDTLTQEYVQTKTALEGENKQLKEENELMRNDLESVTKDLQMSRIEIEKHAAEIDSSNKALSNERDAHSETQKKLTTAEKEIKSSSLIDLELADYQRSVEGLRKELEEKKVSMAKLEEKLVLESNQREQVQREKEDIKHEVNAKDEMANKLKAMLRKTTKELSDAKAQINEGEITVGKCEEELEKAKLEKEQAKMEMASLTAKMQADTNEHHSSMNHQTQLVHSLESKVTRLHSQSLQLQEELKKAKEEHENYKVRVHSVLKQKSSTPSVDEIESGLRQKHELDVLKMKAELKDAKDQLSQVLVEHEELELEHHQLSSRHEQLLLDSQSEKQQLNNKLFELETKYRSKSREYEDVIGGLKRDIIENTRAFNRQLLDIQDTHNSELTRMRNELKTTTAQLDKLQQEADSLILAKKNHKSQISRESSTPVNEVIIVPSEERSAGEGMDVDELKNSENKDETDKLSLERLLSTSSTDLPRVYSPVASDTADVTALQIQVQATQEKIGHLRELLYESEDNCVRLTDQAKLLKEEIRRLERNNERLREASNMEYMKNVVLKFLHNDSANERAGLIPVIAKLLQLSQQEVKYLTETIEGNNVPLPDPSGVNPAGGGGASRWGSYLHRWTGY